MIGQDSAAEAAGATVIVADTDALSRTALCDVLTAELGMTVVANTADPAAARMALARYRPALLLVDIDLGRSEGGLDLLRARGDTSSATAALGIADREDPTVVISLLRAGACGYVPRSGSLPQFVSTVRAALRGEACLPRRVMAAVLSELLEQRRAVHAVAGRYSRLSAREREVLGLLGRGADNTDIARALVISPETVRTHVQNVLGKLEVHSRVEAAALAVAHGFSEGDGGTAA